MKRIKIYESSIEGKGIFADEDIKKGETVFKLSGPLVRREMRSERESKRFINWIGVGKNLWINPNPTKHRHFNHSCDPNTAILKGRTVVAIRSIKKGEEITFDYSSTDTDPLWRMECKCDSKNCRRVIGSVFLLEPKTFEQRAHYIRPFASNEYLRAREHLNAEPKSKAHAIVK